MAKTCRKCGLELNKGNVQVVRRPGKRPFRIHRACPKKPSATAGTTSKTDSFAGTLFRQAVRKAPGKRPGGQRTGLTGEGVLDYAEPVKYRYFITPVMAERLKKAITGKQRNFSGVGITVEVIPVPDFQVEADPDTFAELVEINLGRGLDAGRTSTSGGRAGMQCRNVSSREGVIDRISGT